MRDATAVGPNSTAQCGVPCAIHRSAPERIVRKRRYRIARFSCGDASSRTLVMQLWFSRHLAFERGSGCCRQTIFPSPAEEMKFGAGTG